MKQLFVMDPLDGIQVEGDSTYALMLEACRRSWSVSFTTPAELWLEHGQTWARATPVAVTSEPPFFSPEARVHQPLSEYDVIWMRKDPPYDIEYVFCTYLLDLAGPRTLVLNDPAALRSANEKLYALQWPHLCPPTLVTRDLDQGVAWCRDRSQRVVLKPWDGNGGHGVLVSAGQDGNLRAMLELLTYGGQRHVMLQEYVPEIVLGDKRIILIEGEPRGWIQRVPQPGDHRGNIHVGARVEACELTDRDRQICSELAPRLEQDGLLFVGIDVIGAYLTEINVTSPTGIREILDLQGVDLAVEITDAVQARWKQRCTEEGS